MSTRSLKNKLKKIEATLPPPPPLYEELPIEEWVAERIWLPETTLKNTTNEERFYEWLEELPRHLLSTIGIKVMEVRNEGWTIHDPISPLPPEIDRRVVDALPPHVERQRGLWADNLPSREKRRRWVEEMDRLYPRVKARDNGYGWWFRAQENYARLRERYSGFEKEWAAFYEQWQEKYEKQGRDAAPVMEDRMRDAFLRCCFFRGEHDGEAAPD